MPIISKSILENTKLASGYRIKLAYTFSDGAVKEIKCRGVDANKTTILAYKAIKGGM